MVATRPSTTTAKTVAKVAAGTAAGAAMMAGKPSTTTHGAVPSGVARTGAVTPIATTSGKGPANKSGTTGGSTVARNATAPPGTAPARAQQLAMAAPLDDHVTYQYNALGRRDVFNSLIDGSFVGADMGGDAPPDVGGLKVVGIVWGSEDQFAMVEDVRGDSYVLRRGDKVMNGFVEGLKRDAMMVNITVDGQSQSVTIPVTRKGEKSNANR
jgi:hypothetical protein